MVSDSFPEEQTATKSQFSWDTLRFVLEGLSPIDLPALAVANRGEAQSFLVQYGYDMENPQERDIVRDLLAEAVHFIKAYFCKGTSKHPEALVVPAEIERINDCRDLLVWASLPGINERQAWACAVLRVMHTINHLNNTMRVEFFPEIKRQVLDRFKQNIHYADDGSPVLGRGPLSVPLHAIMYKEEKSRDSLIMKLLHKTNNVAEKVHDRLGVKLVTSNKFDVLRVLRLLRQTNITMFANLTPGRSRNTLLDLDSYRQIYDQLLEVTPGCSEEELEHKFTELVEAQEAVTEAAVTDPAKANNVRNPFSSPDYQSIQFTVQQLVKLENPGFFKARRMRVQLEKYHLGPDLEGLLDELEGPGAEREMRILFPLEVQLIDKENYHKSIVGTASHDEYKKRQTEAACDRVMRQVYIARHHSTID